MIVPGQREGFVKRVSCRACGAPKVMRSQTAYVYCDYCAVLTDWDFQIAISRSDSALPGPAYEALHKELAGELASALARGDREAHLALQRRLFASYVDACPASCSPRIGDPAYRAAYVEYSARCATIAAFDPEVSARMKGVDDAVRSLQWNVDAHGQTKVESTSFWRMFDALSASIGCNAEAYAGVAEKHPDAMPPELGRAMSMSILVQGWIPYLDEKDVGELLGETGLAAEYVKAPVVSTSRATCGNCCRPLTIPEGAKRTLCEACGHIADARVVPCGQCGATVALPEGANAFACPFCKVELRAMRW